MAKSQRELEPETTLEPEIYLDEAEDFKLPSDGYHLGNLTNVEWAVTKKTQDLDPDLQREQLILSVTLSPEDTDAPNLPMRLYLGWPYPEDKDTMWGSRTAWGSKIKSIKDVLTAFGGQESGPINKAGIYSFLQDCIGQAVKVKVKQSKRDDTDEMQANIQSLSPA
jgi:hypothetical protein